MNEETQKKEEQGTSDNTNEGIQQKTISELDRADQIAQMQKRENDRREEILIREENLHARKMVGGNSEAGQTQEVKKETDKEYSDRIDQEIRDGKEQW
jgi:hypothetical protein